MDDLFQSEPVIAPVSRPTPAVPKPHAIQKPPPFEQFAAEVLRARQHLDDAAAAAQALGLRQFTFAAARRCLGGIAYWSALHLVWRAYTLHPIVTRAPRDFETTSTKPRRRISAKARMTSILNGFLNTSRLTPEQVRARARKNTKKREERRKRKQMRDRLLADLEG